MEYCFVAGNYPTSNRQVHVFLQNVVEKLVDRGEKCNVIAPQSYVAYFLKRGIRRKIKAEYVTANGNKYMVYSPLYCVTPKLILGKIYLQDLQRFFFYKALERVYKKNGFNADLIYSHFVQIGIAGTRLAKKMGIPSFIANGEADTIKETRLYNPKLVKKTLKNVTGIISVSTKNRSEIFKLSDGDAAVKDKVSIIVNAADSKKFYKKDKLEIRKKMGWPENAFIVAFTGSFIERKGVFRLCKAIDRFDDVYAIFMGVGDEKPNCKNILHCGKVVNSEMVDYLNAADVFVLPTQAEGCSNAIVEAISCGLPVISSNLEFNFDVLDESCAILIDPNSVDEIAEAIKKMKDNEYRNGLMEGAQLRAKQLSLDVRIDRIQHFISQKMEKKHEQ